MTSMSVGERFNAEARRGMTLLFNNEFIEAEKLFESAKEQSPVHALGYGIVRVLQAVLTFNDTDIQGALTRLKAAKHFIQSRRSGGSSSYLSWLGWGSSSSSNSTPPEFLDAELDALLSIIGLLSGILHFLVEDAGLMTYVKGTNLLRRSYNQCHELDALSQKPASATWPSYLRGDVNFGIGLFNMTLSMVPPGIRKIFEKLGFKGDAERAVIQLLDCAHGPSFASPLAAIVLHNYHVFLSMFYVVPNESHLHRADVLSKEMLGEYPHGSLILWMHGRVMRSKGQLDAALEYFAQARSEMAQKHVQWQQINHLCHYEAGFCYMLSMRYTDAAREFTVLRTESNWSRAFYGYLEASCWHAAGEHAEALKVFELIPGLVKRRGFRNKPIPLEKFALRRAIRYTEKAAEPSVPPNLRLICPVLELIFLWNGMGQCKPFLPSLTSMISSLLCRSTAANTIQTSGVAAGLPSLAKATSSTSSASLPTLPAATEKPIPESMLSQNDVALLYLLQGCIHYTEDHLELAELTFRWIEYIHSIEGIKEDLHVMPFMYLQWGALHAKRKDIAAAQQSFITARTKFTKYDFEHRLGFRLNCCQDLVNMSDHQPVPSSTMAQEFVDAVNKEEKDAEKEEQRNMEDGMAPVANRGGMEG